MRVLITGMGGELGTRVANLLEADDTVTDIVGIDGYPPRRRITRADFHLIDPKDRRRIVEVVRAFDPEVLLHLATYEPHAHFGGTAARRNTQASAVSTLGAATGCPSLRRIVVRSGIPRSTACCGAPMRPDETSPIDPTNGWGRSLGHVEHLAYETGGLAGVPVVALPGSPRRPELPEPARPLPAPADRVGVAAGRAAVQPAPPGGRRPGRRGRGEGHQQWPAQRRRQRSHHREPGRPPRPSSAGAGLRARLAGGGVQQRDPRRSLAAPHP